MQIALWKSCFASRFSLLLGTAAVAVSSRTGPPRRVPNLSPRIKPDRLLQHPTLSPNRSPARATVDCRRQPRSRISSRGRPLVVHPKGWTNAGHLKTRDKQRQKGSEGGRKVRRAKQEPNEHKKSDGRKLRLFYVALTKRMLEAKTNVPSRSCSTADLALRQSGCIWGAFGPQAGW